MTSAQVSRLASIVADLTALREVCEPADRAELSILILECVPLLARPCDPENLIEGELCDEHRCSLWICCSEHGQ